MVFEAGGCGVLIVVLIKIQVSSKAVFRPMEKQQKRGSKRSDGGKCLTGPKFDDMLTQMQRQGGTFT